MRLQWTAIFLILCYISVKAHGACICNQKGTDYCASCTDQVVRPNKQESHSDIDLPPIGDSCWCSKSTVVPVPLPPTKPCPKHKTYSCSCKYKNGHDQPYAPHNYPIPQIHYSRPVHKDESLPADPISVSLAMQAGKAVQVPEAKLAYGFVQKPIDGLKKVYFSNVPEENLYKLKSEVMTLQRRSHVTKKDDEEYVDEHEEVDDGYADDEEPHLTYKQLGYVAEQYKNPKFHAMAPRPTINYDTEHHYSPNQYKKSYGCGMKSMRHARYPKDDDKHNIEDY